MFAKYLTAALAGTALFAAVASAQTQTPATTPAPSTESSSTTSSSYQGDWRASKVVGLNVYNDSNEKLGSINDLLMDKSGSIKAVVLGVGGFLGMGEHLVAVPLDKVKFVNEPVVYSSNTGAGGAGTMTKNPGTTGSNSTPTAGATKPNPWYPDHAVFDATKDSLKAMAEFKYSE